MQGSMIKNEINVNVDEKVYRTTTNLKQSQLKKDKYTLVWVLCCIEKV